MEFIYHYRWNRIDIVYVILIVTINAADEDLKYMWVSEVPKFIFHLVCHNKHVIKHVNSESLITTVVNIRRRYRQQHKLNHLNI